MKPCTLRLILVAGWLFCFAAYAAAQDDLVLHLDQSVVQAKVPKRLRTFAPFWGVPQKMVDGRSEKMDYIVEDEYSWCPGVSGGIPQWVTWNLDLVSIGEERDKFSPFLKSLTSEWNRNVFKAVINECYKWAWSRPYGNTNVVCGGLYDPDGVGQAPYALFVAVCKKARNPSPRATGFSSVAFIVPLRTRASGNVTPANIYDMSTSVNVVEYHSGLNLFPGLPSGIQEIVEGMTTYELFCPFQETEFDEEDLELEIEQEVVEYSYD